MALNGPSKEFATIRGQAVFDEVMKTLKAKYGVDTPYSPIPGLDRQFKESHNEQKQILLNALIELIWIEEMASF